MGAMANAFHGLGAKGPLGGMNKAIGTVGGKIGMPGMSAQGVPGFKAAKPSLGQQVGQLGALGQAAGLGANAAGQLQPGTGATAGQAQPGGEGEMGSAGAKAPMQAPGAPAPLQAPGTLGGFAGAAMGALNGSPMGGKLLTPKIAMSGAQPAGGGGIWGAAAKLAPQIAGKFPAAQQGQGDQNQQNPWGG